MLCRRCGRSATRADSPAELRPLPSAARLAGLRSNRQSSEPPSLAARADQSVVAHGVLSAKAVRAASLRRCRQGVSGGQLLHRVPPVYPAQARSMRVEGTVILTAMVMEDGTLGDVKVVDGPPVLAPVRCGRGEVLAVPTLLARRQTHEERDQDHNRLQVLPNRIEILNASIPTLPPGTA